MSNTDGGNCRIEQLFDAPLNEVMDKNQQKIAANIRREAKFADVLMIWTDCDREGEYIGWEVYMEAQKSNRRLMIIKFTEQYFRTWREVIYYKRHIGLTAWI